MAPHRYTAGELHQFLVSDAVKGHPTDVRWALEAYAQIGQQRHRHLGTSRAAEQAYQDVAREVASLGRSMPGVDHAV